MDGDDVFYQRYLKGEYYAPMDFRRFPFDSQHLVIEVGDQAACAYNLPCTRSTDGFAVGLCAAERVD